MVEFTCSCGKSLQADDQHAGRRIRCPACTREQTVPSPGSAVTPDVPTGAARSSDVRTEPERRGGRDYDDRPLTESSRTSGKAIAALVLGVVSLGCSFFAAIPALVLGFLALSDIGKSAGRLSGKPLAWVGIAASAISLFCIAPMSGLGGYFAYSKVSVTRDRIRSQNNLKQIGLGIYNYEMTYTKLPPTADGQMPGQPPASWRVHILPYIEEEVLYRQHNFSEPWDGPTNSQLLTRMPKLYKMPGDTTAPPGHTYYQAFVSPPNQYPQTALVKERKNCISIPQIVDGSSNTILIVEAATSVPWTKPEDLNVTPNGPLPSLGRHHANGCNALFADGSVRFVPGTVSATTLRALTTRDGGDVPGGDFDW